MVVDDGNDDVTALQHPCLFAGQFFFPFPSGIHMTRRALARRVIRLQRQFGRRLALENRWPGARSSEDSSKSNHSFETGLPRPDRASKKLQNDLGVVSSYAFPAENSFAKWIFVCTKRF